MAIEVQVLSDSQLAQRDLEKLNKSVDNISKTAAKVTDSLKAVAMSIGSIVIASVTLKSVADMSDALASMSSKLKLATNNIDSYNESLLATRKIALSTRQDLTAITNLYSRIGMSSKQLGATNSEILVVTQSVAKAISISGAGAQEAQAAVMQLGQALASGKLQGDELRSILENAPQLAKAIADGLGTTIGNMRLLGAEGKLTSREVFQAILSQTNKINASFNNINHTFSASTQNLKNSILILFDAFNKLGSGNAANSNGAAGGLAKRLNDLALSIGKIGLNLDSVVLDMRVSFWRFIYDVVTGFEMLPNRIKGSFDKLGEASVKQLSVAKDTFLAGVSNIEKSFSLFGLTIKVNPIKLSKFIPNLSEMNEIVWRWVGSVERAFFWLYDQVIGHSWVPDLVIGVITWFKMLLDKPMKIVSRLVAFVNEKFKALFKNTNDLMPITDASTLNTTLNDQKSAYARFFDFISGKYDKLSASVKNNSLVKDITASYEIKKANVETTKFIRNLKQVLGVRDTVPGTYNDRTSPSGVFAYDNEALVARGTKRNSPNRGMLHDIVSAFSSQNQIPFLAAVTSTIGGGLLTAVGTGSVLKGFAAMFGLAIANGVGATYDKFVPIGIFIGGGIIAALTGGTATKALAGIITTLFGVVTAQFVSNKEISLTTQNIAKVFLDGVTAAVEKLFGSGIFGEKGFGGTLALLAKLALLFKAGREAAVRLMSAAVKAPATIADSLSDRGERALVQNRIRANAEKDAQLQQRTAANMQNAVQNMAASTRALRSSIGANGQQVGSAGVSAVRGAIANGQDLTALTRNWSTRAQGAAAALQTASTQLTRATSEQFRANQTIAERAISTQRLQGISETLSTRIAESNAALRAGVTAAGGGIGGIFGTLGGFNLGAKIADQMVGYSDWAKIGVQMSTAFIGQLIGAGIGQIIARGLLATVASWAGLAALAIGTALYTVFNVEEVGSWFEEGVNILRPFFRSVWEEMKTAIKESAMKSQGALNTALSAISPFTAADKIKESGILEDIVKVFSFGLSGFLLNKSNGSDPKSSIYNDVNTDGILKTLNDTLLKLFGISDAKAGELSDFDQKVNRLASVISTRETGGIKDELKATVKSIDGAIGRFQIMPATFAQYAKPGEIITNEADNMAVALRKIRDDLTYFGGDIKKTAAAYHGGRGAVMANGEINPNSRDGNKVYTREYAADIEKKFFSAKDKIIEGAKETGRRARSAWNNTDNPLGKLAQKLEELAIKFDIKAPPLEGPPLPEGFTGPAPVEKKKNLREILESTKTPEASLDALNEALSSIGAKVLTMSEFEMSSPEDLLRIVKNFDEIAEFQEKAANTGTLFARQLLGLTESLRKDTQNIANRLTKSQSDTDKLFKQVYDGSAEAGTKYLTKFQEESAAGLASVFKGEIKLTKYFENLGTSINAGITEAFSKALVNSFTKYIKFDELISSTVAGVFNFGGNTGGSAGGGIFNFAKDLIFGKKEDTPKMKIDDPFTKDPEAGKKVKELFNLSEPLGQSRIETDSDKLLSASKEIASNVEASADNISSAVTASGEASASSLGEIFSSGLRSIGELFNGAWQGLTSFFGDLLTPKVASGGGFNWVSTALGLVGSLFGGGGGGIDAIAGASELGNIANATSGVAYGASSAASNMSTVAMSTIDGMAEGFTSSFAKSLSNTTLDISAATLNLKGYASGGYIRGPGTPTSDSIPAMLSDKEFVVNAKQTAKFRPLLEAINSGNANFADGGFVGAVKTASSTSFINNADLGRSGQGSGDKIFHISVTGDVSRQTRREIVGMMEEIAAGVNQHNVEAGRR